MPVCKVCKESKAIREMRHWGGKDTETCQACYDAKKAQKENGGAAAEPTTAATDPPPPTDSVFELTVEPSFGFTANLTDGQLVITQQSGEREDPQAPDNITLTRGEARALFELFGNWAQQG